MPTCGALWHRPAPMAIPGPIGCQTECHMSSRCTELAYSDNKEWCQDSMFSSLHMHTDTGKHRVAMKLYTSQFCYQDLNSGQWVSWLCGNASLTQARSHPLSHQAFSLGPLALWYSSGLIHLSLVTHYS